MKIIPLLILLAGSFSAIAQPLYVGRFSGNAFGLTNIQEAGLVFPAVNPAANFVLTSTGSNTAAWLPASGASLLLPIVSTNLQIWWTNLENAVGMHYNTNDDEMVLSTSIDIGVNSYFGLGHSLTFDNEPYGAGWAGDLTAPTKNALYGVITNISTVLPLLTNTIGITIDGGGAPITTGLKGYIVTPYACTIIRWTLTADVSGSIDIDVWCEPDPYDGGGVLDNPPTGDDTIIAEPFARPILASQQGKTSTDMNDWFPVITNGSMFGWNVESASTVTRVTLQLTVTHAP